MGSSSSSSGDTAEETGKQLKYARRYSRAILEWSQSRIAFHRLQSVWDAAPGLHACVAPAAEWGSLSTYPASCEQTSVWTAALKYIPLEALRVLIEVPGTDDGNNHAA